MKDSIKKSLQNTVEKLSSPKSYNSLYHESTEGLPMPSVTELRKIIGLIQEIIFPGYFGKEFLTEATIELQTSLNIDKLFSCLSKQIRCGLCFDKEKESKDYKQNAEEITALFIESLPEIRSILATDIKAAYNGDPAAKSFAEIILCYPCIRAILNYRIANTLQKLGVPLIPRIITEIAHSETGIDIHPEATIGKSFTIDHGTGVVIGATCIIGENVQLYQGVTLGAKSFPLDKDGNPIKGVPRHPIVEDNVVIYSNATILGRITIGKGATIGGNVWVTNDVEPNAKVLQK